MLSQRGKEIITLWTPLSTYVYVPQTEEEYDKLVALLDELIDEVGEDEAHPLASLMGVIGTLVEKYEDEHIPDLTASN